MPDRFVLVLAGGRGERFWPWSRPERPKQLLPLAGEGRSLLSATFERARRVVSSPDHVLVMTAPDLRDACQRECPGARILAEPVARNTAPAIAAAAGQFVPEHSAFAVLPADHAIDDVDAFVADLTLAFEIAEREPVLVTFGIRPSGPDTNFGYIRRGARVAERLHRVAQFTEKPDRARAEAWLATGEYAWNSGIFVWRSATFFDALAAGRPALAKALRGFGVGGGADAFEGRLAQVFPGLEAISVDYAVLEPAPNVVMLEPRFDWDDLGSWNAWARRQPRDPRGNVLFGDALALDCDDCVVVGEGGVAAALGLRDMVVVNANGSMLACRLDHTEQVRRVSEALRARART
ncbi:MAG TPA: mannose-1-phosphate guanylyltransferase [Candidatus Limnocylindria bacterium]|nr:mannose-1-phosphate guanylyltransferase [Candidatus Limnocylindria bacterium]